MTVATLVATALAWQPAVFATVPTLDRIEPASVTPYTGFELMVYGSGFDPDGLTVHIEAGTAGRFLSYRPSEAADTHCTVRMPLGFGPRPSERRVYIRNADGSESERAVLRIGAEVAAIDHVDAEAEGDNPEATAESAGEETGESSEDAVVATEDVPEISELQPPVLAAGRLARLEVYGRNFSEGAQVLVVANRNAGSTRLPEYELTGFPTEYVDSELLEVEFDRGFYPIPGARDVVVQNPDGTRSAAALLTIRGEEKR